MGIMSRMKTIWSSYWNAGLDHVENAEYSLDEHIRQMEQAYKRSEEMVAQSVAMRVQLENNIRPLAAEVTKWQERLDKATAASVPDLVLVAQKQLAYYQGLKDQAERDLADHTQKTEELKGMLAKTRLAIENAKAQKTVSVAKYRTVQAQQSMQKHDFLTPNSPVFSEFDRLNRRVRDMQAKVDAVAEIRKDPYDEAYAKL